MLLQHHRPRRVCRIILRKICLFDERFFCWLAFQQILIVTEKFTARCWGEKVPEIIVPRAMDVILNEESLVVDLTDGRTVSVPLSWYPRLTNATIQERNNWRLIGRGEGIHWPDLDEDISIAGLISGKPSGESQTSLLQWLAQREKR